MVVREIQLRMAFLLRHIGQKFLLVQAGLCWFAADHADGPGMVTTNLTCMLKLVDGCWLN